jgi:uncharacterized protein (TIGR00730 family)
MSKRRVCVFCGGNPGNDPAFLEAARALGRGLAGRGWGLVYGGATVGLMGAVADAALEGGGEVIGVIPASLVEREIEHPALTRNVRVETLAQRKEIMFAESDAFVALPGGFGTLDEIFEALTLGQIGEHREKPCLLVNVGGFFDHLVRYLDHAVDCGLLLPRYRAMLGVASSAEEALEGLTGQGL